MIFFERIAQDSASFIDIEEKYKSTALGGHSQENKKIGEKNKDSPDWIGTSTLGTQRLNSLGWIGSSTRGELETTSRGPMVTTPHKTATKSKQYHSTHPHSTLL